MVLDPGESSKKTKPVVCDPVETTSLGFLLKQTREKRGLSIEEVCQVLKIRKLFIESIEARDFNKLPGMIYTTGFVRSYCKFLEIDPDITKQILNQICTSDSQSTLSPFHSKPGKTTFPAGIMRASLILTFSLILVFIAFRWDFFKGDQKPLPTTPILSDLGRVEFNLDILNESLVTFYVLDQTWIQLTDAKGTILETRLLSPGEVYQINRQPNLFLTTGNSQALKVYDGHQALTLPVTSEASLSPVISEDSDLLENYPLTEP
ncbi:helix-turn-helix domain-containing protein [Candidatus Finniella inopinata]|uniref:Helix-turn-helix domain-containing protein n=1 Tax=Candidatus Finniella inopinata TaxID=1696036 RepID=A0A4Q7DL43_9PROT|nr:helix-turn-helix domain-containing protein [Candidatus Finniella inopinata]RZI47120.1 helix-turn-helix domain-containing protein [Candidatus Finniella inopinata]